MDNYTNPLDDNLIQSQKQEIVLIPATSGKRFLNLLIDTIVIYILTLFFLSVIVYSYNSYTKAMFYLVYFITYFLYYISLENHYGRTIGKMITRTKVVTRNGLEATLSTIFTRTLCRIIPLEQFSFLGSGSGLHDSLSNTMVIVH